MALMLRHVPSTPTFWGVSIISGWYNKPTRNITPNGEKLKAFPLRSGIRQEWQLLPLLFNILLEVLATAIREDKEIKGIQIGNKEVKLSVFADSMILFTEIPKEVTRKLLEILSEYSRFEEYKINTRNSLHSYKLTMKSQEEKLREQAHSPLQQKE